MPSLTTLEIKDDPQRIIHLLHCIQSAPELKTTRIATRVLHFLTGVRQPGIAALLPPGSPVRAATRGLVQGGGAYHFAFAKAGATARKPT